MPAASLAGEDARNRELLESQLDLDIQGAAFDEDRIPFTNDEGFFVTSSYAAEGVRIHTDAEAHAWLSRIATLPDYLVDQHSELIVLMPQAVGPELDVFFVYAEEMKHVARVQVFRDYLVEAARRWRS